MSRAEKFREKAAEIDNAEVAARVLLAVKVPDADKLKRYDNIHALAVECLKQYLYHGGGDHHINEAFKPRVLTQCLGEDIYDLLEKLEH